jgi:hypothetical protein
MMVSGSGVREVSCFLLRGFGGLCGTVLEAEAVVPSFKNVTAMGETVEQGSRHLRLAEHGCPFAEAEIGRDDDAGTLVELAQQMEEQRSAGGAERQVAKLVEDDEIGVGEPGRDLAGFALKLLLLESVDEFDGGEEPYALAVMLDGLDADCGGEMRLAGSRRNGRMMPVIRKLAARGWFATRTIRASARRFLSSGGNATAGSRPMCVGNPTAVWRLFRSG